MSETMEKTALTRHSASKRSAILRAFALFLALVLCVSCCSALAEASAGPAAQGTESGEPADEEGSDGASGGFPAEGDADVEPSEGASGGTGLGGINENFDVDDIPEDYLKTGAAQGTVVNVYYTAAHNQDTKSCVVYLPVGYEENDQPYNILYILHASNGTPKNYLNAVGYTKLQRLLDHMIENGDMDPIIVVAASYYSPSDEMLQYMPLNIQVQRTKDFPKELVNDIIPAVESVYRTYARANSTEETITLEDIVASRAHRGIAGFSLGGVATWNVFLQQMQAFKWFLPISEASWDDGEGGTKGILDSDTSAEVLYNAVIDQGYAKEDFMLFVATGGDDEAFDITTTQMVSLLEYADMFKPGENVSCSMMNNGEHTLTALYTYLYHILPALFSE